MLRKPLSPQLRMAARQQRPDQATSTRTLRDYCADLSPVLRRSVGSGLVGLSAAASAAGRASGQSVTVQGGVVSNVAPAGFRALLCPTMCRS